MSRKKKRATYGDYCTEINGRLYAVVNIPDGIGKYKKRRKRVANKIEAKQWALGQLHRNNTDPRDDFRDLAVWYKEQYLVPPIYQNGKKIDGLRTYQTQRTTLDRLTRYFGPYSLDSITVDVLRKYKREKLQKVSITSVNRDFALLNTMFERAVNRRWMPFNPFKLSERLIESALETKGRSPVSHRQVMRLLARSRKSEQPLLFYLILFLADTGARPSEAYPYDAKPNDGILREPVTWSAFTDNDFKAVRLIAYKGRVREERLVPTSERLEKVFRMWYSELQPSPDALIFPQASFKTAWHTLCRNARIDGVTLRHLRTYFNTTLVERGDIDEVSRMLIMGQKRITTNLLYASITPELLERFRRGKTR